MSLTAPVSQVGTTVYIAEGAPATENQAGYEALAWDKISKVTEFPETGDASEDGTVTTLEEGRVEHFNGARDQGSLVIPYVFVSSDAGQQMCRANENSSTEFSLKVVDNDGTVNYYVGVIGPVRDLARVPNTNKGQSVEFRTISGRITVAA